MSAVACMSVVVAGVWVVNDMPIEVCILDGVSMTRVVG